MGQAPGKEGGCLMQSGSLVVTVKDCAAMLGICDRTVRNLLREKRIPGVRIGRRVMIRRAVVEEIAERGMSPDDGNRSSVEETVGVSA